jgi:hypothetical protein
MAEEVTVALGDSIDSDAIITIPAPGKNRENAWIDLTVGGVGYSLNIISTDEGVVLDLYYAGHEDEGGIAATTYAFHHESPEAQEAALEANA